MTADLYQCYLKDQDAVLAYKETGHLTVHPPAFDGEQVKKSQIAQALRRFGSSMVIWSGAMMIFASPVIDLYRNALEYRVASEHIAA